MLTTEGKEPAAKCPVNHEDDEDNNYATYDDDDEDDDEDDDDDDDDDDNDDEDGADDDHACGPQAARHGHIVMVIVDTPLGFLDGLAHLAPKTSPFWGPQFQRFAILEDFAEPPSGPCSSSPGFVRVVA